MNQNMALVGTRKNSGVKTSNKAMGQDADEVDVEQQSVGKAYAEKRA